MKIDLTTILNKRERVINIDYNINPADIEDAPELPFDISLAEDINVKGTITDNDRYLKLEALITVNYTTTCDRCLKVLNDVLSFEIERIITAGALNTEELGIDEEDVIKVSEGGVNIDWDVIESVSLELPDYHLCSDDCPGLCQVCGKRLDGSCKCKEEKEIDPRLESFKKILENMK